jgi:hypothetical protein
MRASSSASPALRYGGRGRLPPRCACSARFERATPSVSATAVIGNRPARATASATAVFLPARRRARLASSADLGGRREAARLQGLDLEGLAAEQTLERANALLELAHPGGADHLVVDPDRFPAALGHPPPPVEQQARREAVLAGHERDRHARLQRLLDQPDLLRHRPPPAALHRSDHLDALDLLRHSRMPRLMPRPSRNATCPLKRGRSTVAVPGENLEDDPPSRCWTDLRLECTTTVPRRPLQKRTTPQVVSS